MFSKNFLFCFVLIECSFIVLFVFLINCEENIMFLEKIVICFLFSFIIVFWFYFDIGIFGVFVFIWNGILGFVVVILFFKFNRDIVFLGVLNVELLNDFICSIFCDILLIFCRKRGCDFLFIFCEIFLL